MCLSRVGQIAYGAIALISVGLILGSVFTPAWRQVQNNLQQGQLNQLPPLNTGLFAFACQSASTTNNAYQSQFQFTTAYPNQYGANSQYQAGFTPNYGQVGQQGYNTLNGQQQQQGQYGQNGQYGTGGNGVYVNTASGMQYLDPCLNWWNSQDTWQKVVIVLMVVALIAAVVSLIWDLLTFCACFCPGSILKPLPGLASTAFVALLIAVIIYYFDNKNSLNVISSTSQLNLQYLNQQGDLSYSFYLACGATVASLINAVVGTLTLFLADKCM